MEELNPYLGACELSLNIGVRCYRKTGFTVLRRNGLVPRRLEDNVS